MSYLKDDFHQLVLEHGVLLRHCGALQGRCTEHAVSQERELEHLRAELMRARGRLIVQESALAWEREEREKLQSVISVWQGFLRGLHDDVGSALMDEEPTTTVSNELDTDLLERSLRAADLVICQSGCVSSGSFWRVEDHCKRTGKTCVLVEQPQALRIVRIHPSGKTEELDPACWHEGQES